MGTALAYYLVPMRALGPDSWKIAAALMGRHIGGGNLTSISCIFDFVKDILILLHFDCQPSTMLP